MESIAKKRERLVKEGVHWLTVDKLVLADIPNIGWSGNKNHLKIVEQQIRADAPANTLAIRTPGDTVLAKVYVDHATNDLASTIGQLATHPELQSLGVGTRLIGAAETLITSLGKSLAVLGVETKNTQAIQLYDRLGYQPQHLETHYWEVTGSDGELYPYEARVRIMHKALRSHL